MQRQTGVLTAEHAEHAEIEKDRDVFNHVIFADGQHTDAHGWEGDGEILTAEHAEHAEMEKRRRRF
jgi:hypothetical protein